MNRSLLLAGCLAAWACAAPARAQSGDASFTLVNRGQTAVRELFVTPAGDANWGRNRLERGPLTPGARFQIQRRRDGNCVFDVRVVFTDGRTEDRRNLNTCTVDAIAIGEPAQAAGSQGAGSKESGDPSFRLVNRGPRTIAELFATPAGTGTWGENRLDPGGLPPAAEKLVHVTRTGNCLFDLRVVFADHKAVEKHRTDLCRITDLPVP